MWLNGAVRVPLERPHEISIEGCGIRRTAPCFWRGERKNVSSRVGPSTWTYLAQDETCHERADGQRARLVGPSTRVTTRSLRAPFASLAALASRMVEAPGVALGQQRFRNRREVARFRSNCWSKALSTPSLTPPGSSRLPQNRPDLWRDCGGAGNPFPLPAARQARGLDRADESTFRLTGWTSARAKRSALPGEARERILASRPLS